jgi:tetratricopeptide (TPR) repeat protein
MAVQDEIVRRFGDDAAHDNKIRHRVGWAIVNHGITLSDLDRDAEALPFFDDALKRFGDSDVDDAMACALLRRGHALDALSRREDAVAAYRELIDRFGDASKKRIRSDVSSGLWQMACVLEALGRSAEVEAAYRALVARRDEEHDRALVDVVGWTLRHQAGALIHAGDAEAGLAAYDATVERLAALREGRKARAEIIITLQHKEQWLEYLSRPDEALAVADEIVRRVIAWRRPDDAWLTGVAIRELIGKLVELRSMDRPSGVLDAEAALIELLGDIGGEPAPRERPAPCAEAELAGALADVLDSDCWAAFAVGVEDDPETRAEQARRATELYALSGPWLETDSDETTPSAVTAGLLRSVADGHAVLSGASVGRDGAGSAVLLRPLVEQMIRRIGIDEWAADLGRPLPLEA